MLEPLSMQDVLDGLPSELPAIRTAPAILLTEWAERDAAPVFNAAGPATNPQDMARAMALPLAARLHALECLPPSAHRLAVALVSAAQEKGDFQAAYSWGEMVLHFVLQETKRPSSLKSGESEYSKLVQETLKATPQALTTED